MDQRKVTAVEAVLEQLIEHGPEEMAAIFARAFDLAMQLERERFLGAGLYERNAGRQGHANGYKPRRIDTPAGTVTVQAPGPPRMRASLSTRSLWNAVGARCGR